MRKNDSLPGLGFTRRHSIAELIERIAVRVAGGALRNALPWMEELEPRVLLSAAPTATHGFVLLPATGAQPAATSTPTSGLTPTQMRHAYGMDSVLFGSVVGNGAGQTIAIVDAYNDPNIAGDLHAFDQYYGLSDPSLTVIGEDGTTRLPSTDPAGKGDSWAIEIALDVEWAHVVAPGANIVLVEARSAYDSDLFAAINTARNINGVSVVSMSWGGSEFSNEQAYDAYFTTPAGHTGVTFVASSGDSGSGVFNPAASPNVLAVGGTALTVDASGNYVSETAWNGSSGGLSRYESQPAYQAGIVTQSSTQRAVPDVAFDASPSTGVAVYDSWDFGSTPWVKVGGTSLAAPMWAGVIAIADQGRVLAGKGTLDGATQTLPAIYALPASDFHDITSGSNGYSAASGYDLVTGRGTPIVNLLAPALAGYTVTPPPATPVIGSFSVTPSSTAAGATVTLTASGVQETSGTISSVAFYRETNGTGGLQTATDTFLGNGTVSGTTWTLTTSTTGFATGAYTYYAVAIDSENVSGAVASATLRITAPVPANDNFAAATVLAGTSATATASNVGATKESGEPNVAGNAGGESVWYSWTAPGSGTVSINTHGSSFDTLLGVYTGGSVSALVLVTSDDDTSRSDLTSTVTFNAVAGVTYHIVVDGFNGASGNIDLGLVATIVTAPANDSFASATVLAGSSATVTGSNVGATKETSEPRIAGNAGGKSIWYNWTAPAGGTVTLNTHGSNFDTMLGVYTGATVSALTLVTSDDDTSRNDLTSAVTFNAVAGVTYHIVVDGYNGASGAVALNLSFTAQATPKGTYDSFASAAVLSGSSATSTGTNAGATREPGEPLITGNRGGASVWYAWTAPAGGTVTLNTHGSNFDTMLGVYTGASVSALTLVASDDDTSRNDLTSAVTFSAVAGVTYDIAVDGYNGNTGNFVLNLSLSTQTATYGGYGASYGYGFDYGSACMSWLY